LEGGSLNLRHQLHRGAPLLWDKAKGDPDRQVTEIRTNSTLRPLHRRGRMGQPNYLWGRMLRSRYFGQSRHKHEENFRLSPPLSMRYY